MTQIVKYSSGRGEPDLAIRQAHWNSRATSYDGDFGCAPIRIKALDEVIALTPQQARVVIDAGTGTGRTLRRLMTHLDPSALVVGLDFSIEMLRQSRQRSTHQAHPPAMVQADHTAVPFRSASADVIISTFTLHHIPPSQQLRVLREFRRVLADRGSLIIADQVQADPPLDPAQMKAVIAQTFYPHLAEDDGIKKLSSYGEWPMQIDRLAELMQRAGFGSLEIHRINSIVAVLGAMAPETPSAGLSRRWKRQPAGAAAKQSRGPSSRAGDALPDGPVPLTTINCRQERSLAWPVT